MINVSHISKQFRFYHKPSDRLKEILLHHPCHHTHQALQDISFTVNAGEALGIIGHNGAGKSTLLKLLTGVLLPDSGNLTTEGRITGLLELGTGFNMELNGRQNININGLLIGMSATDIHNCRESIIAFSELGHFIDEPLKTYSSGMLMRLAFSIAIHAEPQCFVVDEALSVGDAHFQQKCMRRIREFRANGGALIFVSHDLNAVKMLCDKALVLDHGISVAYGTPDEAVNAYNRIIARLDESPGSPINPSGYGTKRNEITHARIAGDDSGSSTVTSGEHTELHVTIHAHEKVDDLTLGLMIRDRFGQDIYGTNTHLQGILLDPPINSDYTVRWRIPMNIAPGKYSITLALHKGLDHTLECLHWEDSIVRFEVAGVKERPFAGVCNLNAKFHLQSSPTQTNQN